MPTIALILSALAALALQAQPPADSARSRPAEPRRTAVLPQPWQDLADRARGAPAEFGADVLLRLAESEKITHPDARRELIDDAFVLAGMAQQPLKRRNILPGAPDTRPAFLSRAFAQDLDALTLQCRAVSDMLRVDKRKARELFARVPPPRVPQVTCADSLVYDVSAFYETMAAIAANAFSPKEVAEEEHVKFLAGFAAGISSPVEVGPLAQALVSVKLTPAQLQTVVTAFSSALAGLAGDDRAFSFTVSAQSAMILDVGRLVAACKLRQTPTQPLLEAFRGYLVRQLTGARCLDTSGFSVSPGVEIGRSVPRPPDAITYFNNSMRADTYPPDAVIAPLEGDEIRASKVEAAYDPPARWDGVELGQLVEKYKSLLFTPEAIPWSDEQKQSSQWQSSLHEYLSALADWRAGQAGQPADYFHQKCYLFSNLINVVPNGTMRDLVLRNFLAFLQQNSYQQVSRMEWFLPVNALLVRVFSDAALAPIADEMRNSGDAVISLYARLETLLPRSPAKTLGLL